MNTEISHELEEAIDIYNDGVDEDERIYWWDVLNEMNDLTDDAEVIRVIELIKAEAEKTMARA
jgi:hypothetical protein